MIALHLARADSLKRRKDVDRGRRVMGFVDLQYFSVSPLNPNLVGSKSLCTCTLLQGSSETCSVGE